MGTGSHRDKISGRTGRRGWKPAAVGICAALISMAAPAGASANPLGEVVADTQGAVEEVVSSEVPPVVPPASSPVSTPQLPTKAPSVSVPPPPDVTPSLPKSPAAATPSLPSPKSPPAAVTPSAPSPPHALHDPGSNIGSYSRDSGDEVASPEAASSPAVTTPGPTADKSSGPPAELGRGIDGALPSVGPRKALPHWLSRVWPAISLGRIGRALIVRAFHALGLGSPTATRLLVRLLPAISGFQPTAIGSPHLGVLAEEDASKRDEPSGGPSVGPIHSNPETVAFVILAGLTALAVLAVGSEFPVFRRRHRPW